MAYRQKGWSAFSKKTDPPKKKYPPHYTEEDIKFLEEQNEDIVIQEDKPSIVIEYDDEGNIKKSTESKINTSPMFEGIFKDSDKSLTPPNPKNPWIKLTNNKNK